MKCKNCNNEIEDNALFCKYCGTRVSEEKVDVDEANEVEEELKESDESATTAEINANVIKENSEETVEENVKEKISVIYRIKKRVNVKIAAIAALAIVILCGAGFFAYTKYINTVISSDIDLRDYKIINKETLAFNYSGNLMTGELYLINNNKGTKIADNVAVDTYYINPVKDFAVYSVKSDENSIVYIYKNGESQEFKGEFYKFTEDGQYMLYIEDNKVCAYDCDTGETRKIASVDSDADTSDWIYQYYDKNKTIYLCLGDNKRIYSLNFENEESESLVSNIDNFYVFGLNAYVYKKVGSTYYTIKTQNTDDDAELEFFDINNIQASQDGETILFTATKDEDYDREYALYAMVEGFEEPIRLLSGPVYNFEYKEDSNRIYVYKEDSLYSIDLMERTIHNKNNKELYYNGLNECEAVKLESEITDFRISPDGKNIAVVKQSSGDEEETTENTTEAPGVIKSVGGAFLNVVYADEQTTVNNEQTTAVQTAVDDVQSVVNETVQTTEEQTETTTEERKVGATAELVIIRGEEKKSIDVVDSDALNSQYLGLGNNTLVYPLAVNGKVELHIVKNINKGLSDIEKNDEILCTNTGLFKYDNIFDELVYFDKNSTLLVNYEDYKASKADESMDYDLIYLDAGNGFDNYRLAYRKLPDYNSFVGKYKVTGDDAVLNNMIIEFTADKQMKVYSIGEMQGSCSFKINENNSNRTSLRIEPSSGSNFSAKCNPYYDHSDYTHTLLDKTLMTDSALLIADFDGKLKYKVDYTITVGIEKLSDEDFNSAISTQKVTHNQNVTKLNNEKAAAEAAAAEEARREALEELALDYYIYGVYVTSYETLYNSYSRSAVSSRYFTSGGNKTVYDYHIDYDSGDIWLKVKGNYYGRSETYWVLR